MHKLSFISVRYLLLWFTPSMVYKRCFYKGQLLVENSAIIGSIVLYV